MNTARGAYIRNDGLGHETIRETFTCCHCNKVRVVPAKHEPFGFCNQCFARTCANDECGNRCSPFEKKLLEQESRAKMLAAIGI